MAKITALLEKRLRHAAPGDLVDVVIEVTQSKPPAESSTKSERHAALERHFGVSTIEVTQLIQSVGGEVLGSSWLSSAIKARLPVESVERLGSLDDVELIDLPRQLTRG